MFRLSSVARLISVTCPLEPGVQLHVQSLVPEAGCQVAPPSTETSTPATTPPPLSLAVPVIVTEPPGATVEPAAGEVIAEAGGSASVEAAAATSPGCRLPG